MVERLRESKTAEEELENVDVVAHRLHTWSTSTTAPEVQEQVDPVHPEETRKFNSGFILVGTSAPQECLCQDVQCRAADYIKPRPSARQVDEHAAAMLEHATFKDSLVMVRSGLGPFNPAPLPPLKTPEAGAGRFST